MYIVNKQQIDDISHYIFLEDELALSDLIFIPGCARPDHTEEAARLYKAGYAPLIVVSGAYPKLSGGFQPAAGGDRYGSGFGCEADYLKAVLMANGVPEGAILTEREAVFTLENAEKSRRLLEDRGLMEGLHRAILCCKAHHARRAYFYYQMLFPELEVIVHPVPIDGICRDSWHLTPEGRKQVLGELSRMGLQMGMMEDKLRFSP